MSRRGVAHLTFPVDMQEADRAKPGSGRAGHVADAGHRARVRATDVVPQRAELEQAAAVLNDGEKVVILAGSARGVRATSSSPRDLLGAPVVKSLSGKMAVPDDHPNVTGGIGLLGTKPSEEAIDDCDTIFMVGTNFPYTRWLPVEKEACRSSSIPMRLGNRIPLDAGLVGDAKEKVAELLPLLHRKEDRSFLETAQEGRDGLASGHGRAGLARPRPDPAAVPDARSLDRYAEDDAILNCDSGTIATWAARHFDIRGGREFYL